MNPDSDTAVLQLTNHSIGAERGQDVATIHARAHATSVEDIKRELSRLIGSANPPHRIAIALSEGEDLDLASAFKLLRPLSPLFRESHPTVIEILGIAALCDNSFRAEGILTSLGLSKASNSAAANSQRSSPLTSAHFESGRTDRTTTAGARDPIITENKHECSALIVYRDVVSDQGIFKLFNSFDPKLRQVTIDLRDCSRVALSTMKALQGIAFNRSCTEEAPLEIGVLVTTNQKTQIFETPNIEVRFNRLTPDNLKIIFSSRAES